MTKYDDHMIHAASLSMNGNDIKAYMHEEHAQYNYGFGARPKPPARRAEKPLVKRKGPQALILKFEHFEVWGEDFDDSDTPIDTYTIKLAASKLAAVQKGKILKIEHGGARDPQKHKRQLEKLSRDGAPFKIGMDVWLTIGGLTEDSEDDFARCSLTLHSPESPADEGNYCYLGPQITVVPAMDGRSNKLVYNFSEEHMKAAAREAAAREAAAREAAVTDPKGKRKRQDFGRTMSRSEHKALAHLQRATELVAISKT